jgi:hypothetical protein
LSDQFLLTVGLSAVVILVLVSGPMRRLHQGAALVTGALLVGLIALAVFFGPGGWAPGVVCAVGLVTTGLGLYGLLALMERWARGGDDE